MAKKSSFEKVTFASFKFSKFTNTSSKYNATRIIKVSFLVTTWQLFFSMIRNLNFFFKKISEEERIISERVSSLRHQQHRLEADRATIVDQRRHEEVIDLTDQQIQIQNLDPAVVQFNLLGIRRQMEPTTGVVQVVRAAPRVRKPRYSLIISVTNSSTGTNRRIYFMST